MKFIRDRGMTATKVVAILMALGVVGSGVYGMIEAGPHLVNQTVNTVGTLTVSHHFVQCYLVSKACQLLWLFSQNSGIVLTGWRTC